MEFRETTLGDDRDRRAPREVPTVAPEILILALLQSPSFPSAFDIVQICPAIIPGVTNEAKQVGVTQNLREHSDNQWAVIGSDNMVLHKKKHRSVGKTFTWAHLSDFVCDTSLIVYITVITIS